MKFHSDQIDKLVQQGKISDARRACKLAKMTWNRESPIIYKCQILDQLAP